MDNTSIEEVDHLWIILETSWHVRVYSRFLENGRRHAAENRDFLQGSSDYSKASKF